MAGIIHKIEETVGMGGNKNKQHGGEHKPVHGLGGHKAKPGSGGEHKEGIVDKIKDKVLGQGGLGKGEKKKTKEKNKH